jgi:hypothetical protein
MKINRVELLIERWNDGIRNYFRSLTAYNFRNYNVLYTTFIFFSDVSRMILSIVFSNSFLIIP